MKQVMLFDLVPGQYVHNSDAPADSQSIEVMRP